MHSTEALACVAGTLVTALVPAKVQFRWRVRQCSGVGIFAGTPGQPAGYGNRGVWFVNSATAVQLPKRPNFAGPAPHECISLLSHAYR